MYAARCGDQLVGLGLRVVVCLRHRELLARVVPREDRGRQRGVQCTGHVGQVVGAVGVAADHVQDLLEEGRLVGGQHQALVAQQREVLQLGGERRPDP